jgi:hypothetical protein
MAKLNTLATNVLGFTAATLGVSMIAPGGAVAAGFVEDAKVNLGLRNFYINRNFVDPSNPQSKAE